MCQAYLSEGTPRGEEKGEGRVQELLGHATLASTQVYTGVDQARLMEAYTAAHPKARG